MLGKDLKLSIIYKRLCKTFTEPNQEEFVLGSRDGYKLEYYDDTLTMTYDGGDRCNNGVHRTTVIDFVCDENSGV